MVSIYDTSVIRHEAKEMNEIIQGKAWSGFIEFEITPSFRS